MQFKLRSKFIIPTVIFILVGMGLSSYITYVTAIGEVENVIIGQTHHTVESISTNLSEWVERNKLDISRWASQDIFRDAIPSTFLGKAARKAATPLLNRLRREFVFYESLYLCDTEGNVLASSPIPDKDRQLNPDKQYFRVALAGTVYASEVLKSQTNGLPVYIIAAPISIDGTVKGVLAGTVSLEYFSRQMIDSVQVGNAGYAFILNGNGKIVAHPDKSRLFEDGTELSGKYTNVQGLEMEQIRPVSERISVVKSESQLGVTVGLVANRSEVFGTAAKIRKRVIIITSILSLLVITLLTLIVSRFVISPIQTFVKSMRTVSSGNLDRPVQVSGTDEFAQMAQSFNEMADSLKESKNELERTYLKLGQKERMAAVGELTARIAHEIKNPLGIIKGSAQILIEDEKEQEIKKEVAEYIIEEVNQLSIRIQELLDHTKPMQLNRKPVNLNALLEERIQFWESQYIRDEKVSIQRDFDEAMPFLNLDEARLRQLAINLILNSCEAMVDGGVITIHTYSAVEKLPQPFFTTDITSGVALAIEDTGCGIRPEDLTCIFDPFFTTKESGTGLGLNAVYRILEKHDAEIYVESNVGSGSRFVILFRQEENS